MVKLTAPAVFMTFAVGFGAMAMLSSAEPASAVPPASVEPPPIVLIINKDQFEGKWRQFKGDLKKQWGDFTDDDLMQIEGKYDKFLGKMQERYGDRKAAVERWTEEWFKKHSGSKRQ